MILRLAWRNLWRRGRRACFNIAVLAASSGLLVFLPSMQAGQYASMIRNQTMLLDGYAQIQRPDYLDKPRMREAFDPGEAGESLGALPGGTVAGERAYAYALVSSSSRTIGARLMGVDPSTEPRMSSVPERLTSGAYLDAPDRIVMGATLARNLRVEVGDSVTVLGVALDGSLAADILTVGGLFRTGLGEIDRGLAQMPIARFDETFSMGGRRHAIAVNGDRHVDMEAAIALLQDRLRGESLAVRDWREMQPGLLQAIELDVITAVFFYAIIVVVVAFSLLNNLMMSVLERTREFGMVLALGIRPSALGAVVCAETCLFAAVGLGAGMALGGLAALWWGDQGIVFESAEEIFSQYGLSATIYPELTPLTLVLGPAVIFCALGLAGLLPLGKILRLRALEAMRAA